MTRPITNAAWDGTTDLNFPNAGAFYALPTAENATQTWMFALYAAPYGDAVAPPGYGYPDSFGSLPSLLCGSNPEAHLLHRVQQLILQPQQPLSPHVAAFNTDSTEAALSRSPPASTSSLSSAGTAASNPTHYFYDGQ